LGITAELNTPGSPGHVYVGSTDATLAACTIPPANYEAEWCSYFATSFEDRSCSGFNSEACFAARLACPGGDHPSPEQIEEEILAEDPPAGSAAGGAPAAGGSAAGGSIDGTAGSSATGGSGGSESAGAGSGAESGEPPAETTENTQAARNAEGGCSTNPRRETSLGWLAIFLAGGLVFRRSLGSVS
jgi:hypothetical protein